MHWVCVPTAEEDFNWIPFFIVGHEKKEWLERSVPPEPSVRGVTIRDESGTKPDQHFPDASSVLDALSQMWRADWEKRTGNEWMEEDKDYQDFATFMKKFGFEVHIGRMEWAQGVIN